MPAQAGKDEEVSVSEGTQTETQEGQSDRRGGRVAWFQPDRDLDQRGDRYRCLGSDGHGYILCVVLYGRSIRPREIGREKGQK
jgi:hypothetical protein